MSKEVPGSSFACLEPWETVEILVQGFVTADYSDNTDEQERDPVRNFLYRDPRNSLLKFRSSISTLSYDFCHE